MHVQLSELSIVDISQPERQNASLSCATDYVEVDGGDGEYYKLKGLFIICKVRTKKEPSPVPS